MVDQMVGLGISNKFPREVELDKEIKICVQFSENMA